ncbi:MAG TPA: sugar ABC transporter substrate-binding protein [Candidatus Limnocylindrales bacterium]|nr:sugar ABC transporter substrate-binding protein [Candidatus Limnocylindrales bacterium]
MNKRTLFTGLAGIAIVLSACNSTPAASGATTGAKGPDGALVKRADIKIEVVTHGQAIDGFWGVVRNGVKAGAADMGVTVNYNAPAQESDMPGMSSLIDAAVAKKPSGLVVSIPNPDALSPAIKKAVEAGIPVVSMNSGSDVFKGLGILAHVGQTELQAGIGAGERFKAAGAKNVVCFNQEVGNQALTLRCNGLFQGMGLTDPSQGKVLTGKISDPTGMQATIAAAIQSDPTIDGLLTLGPSVAGPALLAVTASGKPIHLATFDLSADVLTAIKDGKMDFAIDQQQFLQGYLPIVILTNYAETKNLPTGDGTGLIMTGPGFVTKDNAAAVIALAAKGLR